MLGLSFDKACELLRSTLPDAQFFSFEKIGDVDRYGLPNGQQAATVICYEPRLTNAVRKIGSWIFFIDNRFISYHVQKVALAWYLHKGGREQGDLALVRALRYCFKRFYAESISAAAVPPVGRALLLESIVFERRFINEITDQTVNEGDAEMRHFNEQAYNIVNRSI